MKFMFAYGYNIITQIFSKQYDNEMLAKEPVHDSVPKIIQQSWTCAMDRKELFVVRASAMHVVRSYLYLRAWPKFY